MIDSDPGPFVVSPYVVAELDYILATRRGVDAELAALHKLSGGAWELTSLDASDLQDMCAVIDRCHDQAVALADASLVVLAHRYKTDRLLTLDHRPLQRRPDDTRPALLVAPRARLISC